MMDFRISNQEAFMKKYGLKLGFMSAFIAASAYALKDQPVVNAVIDGSEIVYRDYVDVSVAVATPKGLVVPVLRSVENKNFAEIEIALAAIGDKARKGKISVEDMDGGTFTISNGGVFGSLMGTPIINPPQSAILGMHGVFDRPIAVKGQVNISFHAIKKNRKFFELLDFNYTKMKKNFLHFVIFLNNNKNEIFKEIKLRQEFKN